MNHSRSWWACNDDVQKDDVYPEDTLTNQSAITRYKCLVIYIRHAVLKCYSLKPWYVLYIESSSSS